MKHMTPATTKLHAEVRKAFKLPARGAKNGAGQPFSKNLTEVERNCYTAREADIADIMCLMRSSGRKMPFEKMQREVPKLRIKVQGLEGRKNAVSHLSKDPAKCKPFVLDLSQTLTRWSFSNHLQTMTTGSTILVDCGECHSRILSGAEMLQAHGWDADELTLGDISEGSLHHLCGNAMVVPCVSTVLSAMVFELYPEFRDKERERERGTRRRRRRRKERRRT